MSIDSRMLKCLCKVCDLPESDQYLTTSFADLGLDILEILELIYEIEKEFDVRNLSSGNMLTTKVLSLADIKRQLIQHIN